MLFGVSTVSFSTAAEGQDGSFVGAMAGIYEGYGQPFGVGPSLFTVTSDTRFTTYGITQHYNVEAKTNDKPGTDVGLTDFAAPFTNQVGTNQSAGEILQTQIWELGNSLAGITNRHIPDVMITDPGPTNNEPGSLMLNCYNSLAANQ